MVINAQAPFFPLLSTQYMFLMKMSLRNVIEIQVLSSTGIKEDSCLNTLQYFHVTENVCEDMDDILEGVARLEV